MESTHRELDLTGLDRAEVAIETKKSKRKLEVDERRSAKQSKKAAIETPTDDDLCSETLDGWYSPFAAHLAALRRLDADPLDLPASSFSPVTCEENNKNVVFAIHSRPPPKRVSSRFALKEHAIPNQPGCYILI
jgi:hypothetical protein